MSVTEYKATLASLYETWASLHDLGKLLNESQWKTPTQCPGWSVQDNLSHIVGTERALGGLGDTTHRATRLEIVRNSLGEMNEHEVDSRRILSGADVLKEFDQVTEIRSRFFESSGEEFFAQETMTPVGKSTMAEFLKIRAMDCWVHEQDMRRALNLPGGQDSLSAALSIEFLCRTLPMVVGKRSAAPEGGAVVIHITGPVTHKKAITIINGRATVVEVLTSTPLTEIFFDSNTFVQLATGRAMAQEVRANWKVSGDTALGEKIVGALNMMI